MSRGNVERLLLTTTVGSRIRAVHRALACWLCRDITVQADVEDNAKPSARLCWNVRARRVLQGKRNNLYVPMDRHDEPIKEDPELLPFGDGNFCMLRRL